jgi:amino acid transporter
VIFIGAVSLICSLVSTVDGLARLVNFGAITSFIMLNVAVFWFFFVKEKQRVGTAVIRSLICPFIGTAILIYVWTGFDTITQAVGFSWLAVGLVIGYIKSKGYKEVPEAFKNLKLS